MSDPILCLDSGTTSVKAAAFDRDGRLLAVEEVPNSALRRNGDRVEQDMAATQSDAFAVLRRCAEHVGNRAAAVIVTAQGDGLWPLDANGLACGPAITWLDGRTRGLLEEFAQSGVLDQVAQVIGSRPTTASQSIHLAWLARHDPACLARIARALRCKEWLFHGLTGVVLGEPSSIVSTWGDPRSLRLSPDVERLFELPNGLALLPELVPLRDSARPLRGPVAAQLGLPQGVPVILGPGDVQATAIGLGVGVREGLRRASVFGTSAIHVGILDTLEGLVPDPPGALLQSFVEPGRFLYLHSGFNGTTAFAHVTRLLGAERSSHPSYSGLVMLPFFEPGGERAPITDAQARASLFGLTGASTGPEIAWAAREALAFLACMSHDAMDRADGTVRDGDAHPVALGGGLASDVSFAQFLATALGRPVRRTTSPHAGLAGLGLVAASILSGETASHRATTWQPTSADTILPAGGAVAAYAARKYALFRALLDTAAPLWSEGATLAAEAAELNHAMSKTPVETDPS